MTPSWGIKEVGSGHEKKIFKWGRACRSRRRHGGSMNRRRSRRAHLRDCMQLNLHIVVSHGCGRRSFPSQAGV
jgi:hypothetical protein